MTGDRVVVPGTALAQGIRDPTPQVRHRGDVTGDPDDLLALDAALALTRV